MWTLKETQMVNKPYSDLSLRDWICQNLSYKQRLLAEVIGFTNALRQSDKAREFLGQVLISEAEAAMSLALEAQSKLANIQAAVAMLPKPPTGLLSVVGVPANSPIGKIEFPRQE